MGAGERVNTEPTGSRRYLFYKQGGLSCSLICCVRLFYNTILEVEGRSLAEYSLVVSTRVAAFQ